MKIQCKNFALIYSNFNSRLFVFLLLQLCFFQKANSQDCPPNIDFENGNFNNWKCYIGYVEGQPNVRNVITLTETNSPIQNRHTLFSRASAANLKDYYAGFPVLCPNGSNYSVKLGNTEGGAEAEGISYEFTIPADRNTYALIYNYAVVFQDPKHNIFQQPRLELEITNVTDSVKVTCSSFTFIPNGSALPGFYQSARSDTIPVWCKDWSAVTVNLNGMAGKKIKLFFKTADCTFQRHFGYAYVDINTECSSEFQGAVFCKDDTAVNLIAPYGYQDYTWYNSSFTQVLGQQQTIRFSPPPTTGLNIAVQITPYNGYGCLDTLYTKLYDTLKLKANAGKNLASCNGEEIQIGENPKAGIKYSWLPNIGLSDASIANPRLVPDSTREYFLTIKNSGGGCVNSDTVKVVASVIDSSLILNGKALFCITSNDSAVLNLKPNDSIQWFKNSIPLSGANGIKFKVLESGTYSAKLFTQYGCEATTRNQTVTIESPIQGIQYPLKYAVKNLPFELEARLFGESVLWKPSTNLNYPNSTKPLFTSSFEQDYLYKIEITSDAGCLTVDTQQVKVIKEIKIYVPSAFTPNNDGLNDYLKPTLYGFKQINIFKIFNRYGQLVFDLQQNQKGWNGLINNKPQPTGTYVWFVQGLGVDDKIYTEKGTTVLLR